MTSNSRCDRCGLARAICLCAEIPVIAARTRIVIVRHIAERGKSSNSGRLAALALTNSELLDHGLRDCPLERTPFAAPGTWLLYPEGPAVTVPPSPPPTRLVVLDASWRQSRRMRQHLVGLRGLPVLHLAAPSAAAVRLRQAPTPGKVSTIEAIASALRLLEGEAPAAALEALFDRFVQRARSLGRVAASPS